MTVYTPAQFVDLFDVKVTDKNQSNITELMSLGKVIRQGLKPDSPELLKRYWSIGDDCAKTEPEHAFAVYFHLFNTLLNTASDQTLYTQWRQVCMNNVYRPLFAMQRISCSEHEKRHVCELRKKLASRKFF